MRDNLAKDELEAGVDAASLSKIKVTRPKDKKQSAPKKVKSGDITERLQALAEELEATKPDLPPVKPAFEADDNGLFESAKKKSKSSEADSTDILGTTSSEASIEAEEPAVEPIVEDVAEEVIEPSAEDSIQLAEEETPEIAEEIVPEVIEEITDEDPKSSAPEEAEVLVEKAAAEPTAKKKPIISDDIDNEVVVEPKPDPEPVKEPAAKREKKTKPAPSTSAVPPRRANWARPAATQGWQKKNQSPDILSYWMELRNGNRYPTWQSLDTMKIGKFWPNCVLVHCDRSVGRLQLEPTFSNELRQAARRANPLRDFSSDIDFTPMVVDWVLSLARDVANTAKPAHGTEYFPSVFDEIPLRVIALPLSEDQIEIDHVLCYVQKL
ncbi:MAG: hypothetical protein NXI13_02085 [Proteobacteria bacterium]|nr:hypothetical protein [Pseudomonadota bacterium]